MVMDNPVKRFREFILAPSHSRTISAVVILIIAAAIPLTVLVAQKQQEVRQHAATTCSSTTCSGHAYYACTSTNPAPSGTCCDFTYRCDSTATSCVTACHAGVSVSYCGGTCGTTTSPTPIVSPTTSPTAVPTPTPTVPPGGICSPNVQTCTGTTAYQQCNSTGTEWVNHDCSAAPPAGAGTGFYCQNYPGNGNISCIRGCAERQALGEKVACQTSCGGTASIPTYYCATGVCCSTTTATASPSPTPTTTPDCNSGLQTTSTCVATTSNTCSVNNGTQTAQYTTYNGSTTCNPVNITQTCTVPSCNVGNVCTNGTCIAQATPTPTPTPTATPNPSGSPTPTPTPVPGHTMLAFTIGMDAIGTAGDNVNPNPSSSNQTPGHTSRNLAVQIFNSNNSQVFAQVGSINYNSGSGVFLGTVDLGASFANGNYTVKVKSDGHLRRLIPGIQNISSALTQPIQMLRVNLVAGDVDNNNLLNISDYNILLSCVTSPFVANIDNHALCNTNSNYILLSDLEDNGVINEFDYNLFLREYAVQNGD